MAADIPRPVDSAASAFVTPPMPTSVSEYITTLAHYHRAEIARMAGWRDRIDRTTNWAITGGGAMLSVSLSTSSAHHGVLLFTMLLVMLFLIIEARRYRFFDVYRSRVRLIEQNYFAPLFAGTKPASPDWAKTLGRSLDEPAFLLTLWVAMSRRLHRNYFWIFLMILFAWLLKLSTPALRDGGTSGDIVSSLREMVGNASFGILPGWLVVVAVGLFYGWLVFLTFFLPDPEESVPHTHVHV